MARPANGQPKPDPYQLSPTGPPSPGTVPGPLMWAGPVRVEPPEEPPARYLAGVREWPW